MSKLKKIAAMFMSGDVDSAADAFVARLFNQALGGDDMKLNEILNESPGLRVSESDRRILAGLATEQLDELENAFSTHSNRAGDFNMPKIMDALARFDIDVLDASHTSMYSGGVDPEDYFNALWDGVQDEIEAREVYDEDYDNNRDYTEEDRMAAWNDRYQAHKNEY